MLGYTLSKKIDFFVCAPPRPSAIGLQGYGLMEGHSSVFCNTVRAEVSSRPLAPLSKGLG